MKAIIIDKIGHGENWRYRLSVDTPSFAALLDLDQIDADFIPQAAARLADLAISANGYGRFNGRWPYDEEIIRAAGGLPRDRKIILGF